MKFVLQALNMFVTNGVNFIGQKVSTAKVLSVQVEQEFLRCKSHRLNLTVKAIIVKCVFIAIMLEIWLKMLDSIPKGK